MDLWIPGPATVRLRVKHQGGTHEEEWYRGIVVYAGSVDRAGDGSGRPGRGLTPRLSFQADPSFIYGCAGIQANPRASGFFMRVYKPTTAGAFP